MKNFDELIKRLQLNGIDKTILEQALTHSSYTNEKGIVRLESYERLEFLGDSVLKLCSSEYLYNKFPNYDEGTLTKIRAVLVSDVTLSEFAKELNYADYIKLSSAEERDGGREKNSILACVFESLLGAIYLSFGLEYCKDFLENIYAEKIDYWINNIQLLNPKATLQEYTQMEYKNLPEYFIIQETGLAHAKIFKVGVYVNKEFIASGEGCTKKDAENNAAKSALKIIGVTNE